MNISNTIPVSNPLRRRRPMRAVPSVHAAKPVTAPVSTRSIQVSAAEDDITVFWAMYEMHYDLLFSEADSLYPGQEVMDAAG